MSRLSDLTTARSRFTRTGDLTPSGKRYFEARDAEIAKLERKPLRIISGSIAIVLFWCGNAAFWSIINTEHDSYWMFFVITMVLTGILLVAGWSSLPGEMRKSRAKATRDRSQLVSQMKMQQEIGRMDDQTFKAEVRRAEGSAAVLSIAKGAFRIFGDVDGFFDNDDS